MILGRKIALPADAPWRHGYVAEFVDFPKLTTDQVDATTQFLKFMAAEPVLRSRPAPAIGAVAYGSRPGPLLLNSSVGVRLHQRGRR